MAQNKNTKKPEGLCQKIQNAVSPFRARTFRVSHDQPKGSISITSDKKPPSPRTGPVRVLHQPSLNKMIPVEIEPHRDIAEREVVIVKSRKFSKLSQPDKGDEDIFSDYITKVKDRMMKTASNASGGGGEEISSMKDSFNDKVTNYITRTKIRVRKTTSVGADKSFSFLK